MASSRTRASRWAAIRIRGRLTTWQRWCGHAMVKSAKTLWRELLRSWCKSFQFMIYISLSKSAPFVLFCLLFGFVIRYFLHVLSLISLPTLPACEGTFVALIVFRKITYSLNVLVTSWLSVVTVYRMQNSTSCSSLWIFSKSFHLICPRKN